LTININLPTIFISTTNHVKFTEISNYLLYHYPQYVISSLTVHVPVVENGESFEEIAKQKAKEYSLRYRNKYIICDDSGLMVDYLDFRPGIFSARFPYEGVSDQQRNIAILKLLKDVPAEKRKATFCSAVAIGYNGTILSFGLGKCRGTIIYQSIGTNGFGFDSIFIKEGERRTFAEMTVNEKNEVSHRGVALNTCLHVFDKEVKTYE
jgi:XTP/dITP diphosphohydrolase